MAAMPLSFKELYRFDEFELDPSRRTFVRNGTPVLISPKAFEVLAYLGEQPRPGGDQGGIAQSGLA